MKIYPQIKFSVLASDSRVIMLKTDSGDSHVAAVCLTEKDGEFFAYLLNEVIKGKVYPGPIATEPERGGQE